MKGSHYVPEDCVKIGHGLKDDSHLAMHWRTVKLGDDTPEEQPSDSELEEKIEYSS